MRFADVKAVHKPPEKRVTVVFDGALVAEHAELSEQLENPRARSSLGDPGQADLAARVAEVEAAIASSAFEFVVRGLGRNAYRQIQTASTRDDELDMDLFIPSLLQACIVDPTDVDVPWLMENLTLGQVDELFGAAFTACHEADSVPFNLLVSHPTRG